MLSGTVTTALLAGVLGAATVNENSVFAKRSVVLAQRHAGELAPAVAAKVWQEAPALQVHLYPQRSVRMNDRVVNARLRAAAAPRALWLKAAYTHQLLAVWVSWADETVDQLRPEETDAYGDAVAIELPVAFGGAQSLPYIGMGDDKHHVLVHLKRAQEGGTYEREFVAAGFGSLTAITRNTRMDMAYDAASKRWSAVFVRPLVDGNVDLRKGLVPIAVAVWDGAGHERGGNKSLTGWQLLRLETYALDRDLWEHVAWGEDGAPLGSAARGETLAAQYCVACHRFARYQVAPADLAPDLSGIGGYASAQYLRESIINPSAVVVRHPNINRHYAKSGAPDRFGAYPANAAFAWYFEVDGARVSKMPPFAHLPATDVGDIVAYLKTLTHEEAQP